MPVYDFKCPKCSAILKDMPLSIRHKDDEHPACYQCGELMTHYITTPPMVYWRDPNIDAFRHIALPKAPLVNNMKEHRELMARHDVVDANDLVKPPTIQEERATRAESQESIDAISPTVKQAAQLQEMGLDSIL